MTAKHRRLGARLALVATLSTGSVATIPVPAHALFHLMMVTEVFAGGSTAPNAQFIELQMYAANQRFVAGHQVAVFDSSGTEIAAFTFTSAVPNGDDQSHILLATVEAETLFGTEADLIMTPVLPAGGGSTCFGSADGSVIDCASWGGYSGDDAETGTPFNSPLGILPDQSMERVISGGSDDQALDPEDDTNDSEADFDTASPSPANNVGDEPPPSDVTDHDRAITLRLKSSLVASGKVTTEDDFPGCAEGMKVKVQRKVDSSWRTVKKTTTEAGGSYRASLRDRPGKYRAVAPQASASEQDRCSRAVSSTTRND